MAQGRVIWSDLVAKAKTAGLGASRQASGRKRQPERGPWPPRWLSRFGSVAGQETKWTWLGP